MDTLLRLAAYKFDRAVSIDGLKRCSHNRIIGLFPVAL